MKICFARVKKIARGIEDHGVSRVVNESVTTIILQNPAISRSTGRQVSSFAVLTFDDRSAASIVEIFFGSVVDSPVIIRQKSRSKIVCDRALACGVATEKVKLLVQKL